MNNSTKEIMDLNTTLERKKAALYVRVSTTEQAEEGYSIEEQIRVLKEMCDREGYEVFKIYDDRGISGKSIKGRPALQQLLRDANEHAFDMVLVWKMNRFSRKTLDLLTIVDLLKKKHISFRSLTERHETETPSGVMQFQMMAIIAEFERANIAENVKMGMIARAREGSWNGGQVLGYDVVGHFDDNRKRKQSKLVINEEEASIVREIFHMYTTGHGYKSIANHLNKKGFTTKKNKSFSISAIKTILTNPLYVGMIRFNVRRDWEEKRRNNINPHPVIEKGKHQPIITEETWEKTKSIMKSKSGKPNRIHNGKFPLTGIMKCPVCGSGMVIGRTTNKRKDGTKRILEYYVCGAWENKGSTVCQSNGVRADYADKYVLNQISKVANNEKVINAILSKLNNSEKNEMPELEKQYRQLKIDLSNLQSKKQKVIGIYEDGTITKLDLQNRLKNINSEQEKLEERMRLITEKLGESHTKPIDYNVVAAIMKEFHKRLKKQLTNEQMKQLMRLMIDQITISDKREIESIQITLNHRVLKYFHNEKGVAESSNEDDFATPFSICFDICHL
ncbi:recombinase family protein [Bacillus sp. FSL W8-0183]|uniref:recombinase family protein n=1 Tax=Bacillus sp. FSL W8-0183 TaxID=2954568 RepID=UPI0030FB5B77